MHLFKEKLSLLDLNLFGKRVLMRVDFNVPLCGSEVADNSRIRAAIPSIEIALQKGARLILVSHLGRPGGRKNKSLSLAPVVKNLEKQLSKPVKMAGSCLAQESELMVEELSPGEILLLENLRFHKGEEENDVDFSSRLANLAEIFVNDAFGTAHRVHASTFGVPKILGGGAVGCLVQRELHYLEGIMDKPKEPFVLILGGAKVSDKIGVIEALLPLTNTLIIGGGMAYTFLRAQGINCGSSLVEKEKVGLAKRVLKEAASKSIEVLLPSDHMIGSELGPDVRVESCPFVEIPDMKMALDIGPKTIAKFNKAISKACTIMWNGPMGVFEFKSCAVGTLMIARAVASTKCTSIVGGGDSAVAVKMAGVADSISHVSTGGGACLSLLSGHSLPALEILTDRGEEKVETL